MKPERHSAAQRERARHLVVRDGLTVQEAALRVGVPEGTLKRWSAGEGWVKQREGLLAYSETVKELKARLLMRAHAVTQGELPDDAQIAQAVATWTSVERTWPEKTYGEQALKREVVLDAMSGFVEFALGRDVSQAFREELQQLMSAYFAVLE